MKGQLIGYMHQAFVDGNPGPVVTIHLSRGNISAKTRDAIWALVKAACKEAVRLDEADKKAKEVEIRGR